MRGEVEALRDRGLVSSSTAFPGGRTFRYCVESSPASVSVAAFFSDNELWSPWRLGWLRPMSTGTCALLRPRPRLPQLLVLLSRILHLTLPLARRDLKVKKEKNLVFLLSVLSSILKTSFSASSREEEKCPMCDPKNEVRGNFKWSEVFSFLSSSIACIFCKEIFCLFSL